jgi:hypothetical protein
MAGGHEAGSSSLPVPTPHDSEVNIMRNPNGLLRSAPKEWGTKPRKHHARQHDEAGRARRETITEGLDEMHSAPDHWWREEFEDCLSRHRPMRSI